MKTLTLGSMFSSIGGIDIGFEVAGFNVLRANEFNKKACETFRNHKKFKNIKLFEMDVHKLSAKDVTKVDVLTSGFPCQAFSIAGYGEGFNDKKGRGNLFFETARFIEILRPKAYLLENVKNLQNHDNGNTLRVIKNTLKKDLGYSFCAELKRLWRHSPNKRKNIYSRI